MSRTNRNFIIAYVLLVGLPLLGLAGVLRAGRSLSAPASIDGTWKLAAAEKGESHQPCTLAISSLTNSSLMISQSGKGLELEFDNSLKTKATGTLEGKTLMVPVTLTPQPHSAVGCADTQPLILRATLDPDSEPKSLTGVISVDGCPTCAPMSFRAVRLHGTHSERGH